MFSKQKFCSQKRSRRQNILILVILILFLFGLYQIKVTTYCIKFEDEVESRLRGPLDASDAGLLKYTYKNLILPPSPKPHNLQLTKTSQEAIKYNSYRSIEISFGFLLRTLQKLFPPNINKKGFFVEAGAYDGERNSNTLYLEWELGWVGLLVEPESQNFEILLSKNRKVWASRCCLSAKPYPYETVLNSFMGTPDYSWSRLFTAIVGNRDMALRSRQGYAVYNRVQCLPLQTLLLALNRTHVDLISLDIEDMEYDVLRGFPFSQITVDIWLVEHRHPTNVLLTVDKPDLEFITWFESQGYFLYIVGPHSPKDYIFIRKKSTFYEENRKRLSFTD